MDAIRTLRADEIECRAQIVKQDGCSLLLYKDARCDMRILDEVYGPLNWCREHDQINNNLFCKVGIWDKEKSMWVYKQDAGAPSHADSEKGHSSDAFKRACFNWGIGRELYTAPFIWVRLTESETYQNAQKKWQLSAKINLHVKDIGYTDGVITSIAIADGAGKVRYEMRANMAQNKAQAVNKPKEQPHPNAIALDDAAKGNRGLVVEVLNQRGYTKAKDVPADELALMICEIKEVIG